MSDVSRRRMNQASISCKFLPVRRETITGTRDKKKVTPHVSILLIPR